MGNESEMIPCLDFRRSDRLSLEEGSEGWKAMSKKVREACESHGCFFLMCDEIPKSLCEEMFMNMKTLFDLPEEIKQKYVSPNPMANTGYQKQIHANNPLCETFRIDRAILPATTQTFTKLMWPQGNPSFCETLNSMSSKSLELCYLILKMILEGYGLPHNYTLDVENMKSKGDLRLNKVPGNNFDSEIAMGPHTDKGAITILCENEVHGLQVLTKTGKWIELKVPPNGFVVIVGDILKAWSNGRLQAAKHRVVISGDKERYTFVFFAAPQEDMVINVPSELVDDNKHPLRYRQFNYGEYLHYHASVHRNNDALGNFAGL